MTCRLSKVKSDSPFVLSDTLSEPVFALSPFSFVFFFLFFVFILMITRIGLDKQGIEATRAHCPSRRRLRRRFQLYQVPAMREEFGLSMPRRLRATIASDRRELDGEKQKGLWKIDAILAFGTFKRVI